MYKIKADKRVGKGYNGKRRSITILVSPITNNMNELPRNNVYNHTHSEVHKET